MNLAEQTFLHLLQDTSIFSDSFVNTDLVVLDPSELSSLYINSAFLSAIMNYLKEQLWLKNREDTAEGASTPYGDFIAPFFKQGLASILFLKEFIIESGPKKMEHVARASERIESMVLSLISTGSKTEQRAFGVESLREMSIHFLLEEKRQEGRLPHLGHDGPCLYRTFDSLDELFDLDYQLDSLMVQSGTSERLYQGSGAAVQSGYSTILLALDSLDLAPGSKVVDLGSGFGRVGLVFSLLHQDIDFIGYEYVPHRVDTSNNSCKSMGLEDRLCFKVQDLSLDSFTIPDADVYYLYDPFTKETYETILRQIVEVSQRRKVSIVTKGNARSWLVDIANENAWPNFVSIDEGNLCIFSSVGAMES